MEGYNKTVLTTTTPGVIPFGQSASTTPSSHSTTMSSTSDAADTPANNAQSSATSSPANMTLISGGAIAGTVAGSVLAIAAIIGIVLFILRWRRIKKQHERDAATATSERSMRRFSDRFVYANYAKPSTGFSSPPQSPPLHSRHPSDHMYMFETSPAQSELGVRAFSPESMSPNMVPVELEVKEEERNQSDK